MNNTTNTIRLINKSSVDTVISINHDICTDLSTFEYFSKYFNSICSYNVGPKKKNSNRRNKRKRNKRKKNKLHNQNLMYRKVIDNISTNPDSFYKELPTNSIRLTIPLSGEVALFETPDEFGYMSTKEVNPLTAINILKESTLITRTQNRGNVKEQRELSPILPNQIDVRTLQHSLPNQFAQDSDSEIFIIFKRGGSHEIDFQGVNYPHTKTPHMIFFIFVHKGIVKTTFVTCSNTEFISEDTPLFHCPFPNTSSDRHGSICWGSYNATDFLKVDTAESVFIIPDVYLGTNFTSHYTPQYNFKSNMHDYLKLMSESPRFDYATLKPLNITYEAWVDGIMKTYF